MRTRYTLPEPQSLVQDVAAVELDMEMAMTEDEKRSLQETMAGKTWRTLRIAARNKLSMFDQLGDGKKLHDLFQQPSGGYTRDEAAAGMPDSGLGDSVTEKVEDLQERKDHTV